MIIPPKRIVLTGGGLRTLAHFGALEVLETKGLLKNVKEWVGVSAGCLVGFSLMIGYTLEEAKKVVLEFDFSLLQNAQPESVLDFLSTYGIDTGHRVEAFLQSLLRIRGHPVEITFEQWAKKYPTAPRLRCYATDLNIAKMKEFSTEKTPNTSLVFAMRASMTLPFYFIPMKDPETGHLLVDGGAIQNYPMNYLTPEEKKTALGISFLYSLKEEHEIEEFSDFLNQMYNCCFNPRTYQVQKENKLNTIVIGSQEMSAYNFDLSKEFREAQMETGRKAAHEFCKDYMKLLEKHNKPGRRFSVG